MRRVDAESFAGLAILGVVVVIGALVVVLAGDGLMVPVWVWLVGFLSLLAVSAATMFFEPARKVVYGLTAVQVALGCALVVTAQNAAGFTPILLIMVAAYSVYQVPLTGTLVIIGVHTVVLLAMVSARSGWTEALVTSGLYLLLQVATVFSTVALLRERALRTELAAAHVELQAAAVLQDAVTRSDERLRIARELHDQLGHQLTVLSLELETATHRDGEAAREHVERAKAVARELLGDVRATVGELRRRAPDLREALEAIAASVGEPVVTVSVADDVEADESQAAVLVRVAQEATTNTVRHAEAHALWLEVTRPAAGGVRFVAQDDGRGAAEVAVGNGLRGMVERVARAGGSVRFDGRNGFRVEVGLPPARVAAPSRPGVGA